jgi:hypothetical protein
MQCSYELTSLRWGHTQTRVGGGGGGARHVGGGGGAIYRHRGGGGGGGGGAATHISTESCESKVGGGVVRLLLELPTSWHEGDRAVMLREKKISHSGLRPASSQAPSAC